MGTPLLIVGASAGKLLPKAGPWMDTVKKLFGVMMLGVAAWMLARIVPERLTLLLWAIPALICAWLLWSETRKVAATVWMLRGAGVAVGLYGLALIAGSALAVPDPLAPFSAVAGNHRELPFRTISRLQTCSGKWRRRSRKAAPFWSTSTPRGAHRVRKWRSTHSATPV